MTGKDFMNKVVNGQVDFLQEFLDILAEQRLAACVIGGLAVNTYAEPVVSLDLDVVVVVSGIDKLVSSLKKQFSVSQQTHRIKISSPSSDLRIQIQIDPRYQEFIGRAAVKTVLGYEIPVACLEDVLQGNIWDFSDKTRWPSKRQKDLADIMRLVEVHPQLISLLPDSLQEELNKKGL